MRAEEQFDSFYLKTRRALVHQTFALTGDLGAAQRAVRDAYVAAWHHWRKVSTYEDPREWVRPRAWLLAQRRHTARLWHRTKGISPDDRAVLDALHKLPVAERRALLLLDLVGVPLEVAAREANAAPPTVASHRLAGASKLSASLALDPARVPGALGGLAEAASVATLPRPAAIRREGRRRRRTHTVVAVAAATFLAVGSGAFAHQPPDRPTDAGPKVDSPEVKPFGTEESDEPPAPPLPSADDLLDADDVADLAPGTRWRVEETHDNTAGEGIHTVCQQERFADPEGLSALVRTFTPRGDRRRSLVQIMEVSDSESQARATYDTVTGWFSRCEGGEVLLVRSHLVQGVGDQAMVFELEGWAKPQPRYTVAIAHVGQVVTTTSLEMSRGPAGSPKRAMRALATATRHVCARTGAPECVEKPSARIVPPPPSGDEPGILSTVDLPGLTRVTRPWAGTTTAPGRQNPAATSCDRAHFRPAGAVRTRTRTFLVPGARLPDRFGLTETYGSFPTPRAAASFLETMRQRLARCDDRSLAVDVFTPRPLRHAGLDGTMWRLQTELSESRDVVFDVGFVRNGRHVAQVTFVPAPPVDLRDGDFRALVIRAGQRLRELD